MILKLKNIVNLILYSLFLSFFENNTKNNKSIFLFDDLLFLLNHNQKKKTHLLL